MAAIYCFERAPSLNESVRVPVAETEGSVEDINNDSEKRKKKNDGHESGVIRRFGRDCTVVHRGLGMLRELKAYGLIYGGSSRGRG